MSIKNKFIIGVAALLVVIGSLFAVGRIGQNGKIKAPVVLQSVTLGYRTHDLYAPVFVGIETKIFEQHGLAVKTEEFASTNQLTDALLGGKIDAALGGVNVPLILTIADKSPGELQAFGIVNETAATPLTYLLVRKESSIKSVTDLKNKKIAAFPGSTAQYLYKKTVQNYFDPANAELVQMNPELELPALAAGQVDAAIVLEPLASIAVTKGEAEVLASALFHNYVMNDFPNAASVMSRRFAREHTQAAIALREATREVVTYINSHPNEVKDILAKYLPFERDFLEVINLPYFVPESNIDLAAVQKEANLLYADKQLKNLVDVKSIFVR
ncbi:MAG: ABC transporter substrate-binding protein [Candidatus Magasanikbacteria bacterium]|nr:ABC transporter substrate-binding protein [Candidatus Magasanikbacteria bacterium]